jgi:hypothetical protein
MMRKKEQLLKGFWLDQKMNSLASSQFAGLVLASNAFWATTLLKTVSALAQHFNAGTHGSGYYIGRFRLILSHGCISLYENNHLPNCLMGKTALTRFVALKLVAGLDVDGC